MFKAKAAERISRLQMESETLRSGTERGMVASKTSKAKSTKPVLASKSKVVRTSRLRGVLQFQFPRYRILVECQLSARVCKKCSYC
jgi:hypothetical protein